MPRLYRVTFEAVAVSAAQDLICLTGATGKMCKLKRVKIGATDTTLPTAQMLSLRVRYLPATVTPGSGGSAPTPQKVDPGDAAASFTARVNDTTKATTNGTAVILEESGVHIYNGYDDIYDDSPPFGPTDAVVVELLSTVTGTVHLSGTAIVEETGGAA